MDCHCWNSGWAIRAWHLIIFRCCPQWEILMSKFQCKKFGIFNRFSREGYYYFFSFFFFFSRRRGVWGIIVRWSCDCHKSPRYKVGCHIHVLHWSTALAVWGSEKKHSKTVQKVYHKYIQRERYVCVIPLNMCVCVCTYTGKCTNHVCFKACVFASMCA